jgi:hypothetical protein
MKRAASELLLVAALAAGAGVRGALAADFTAYLGGVKPGSLSINSVRRALDGSPIYGFRLGHGLVPLIGLEHTLAFSSHLARPADLVTTRDVNGFVFNSNLILAPPFLRTVPYATAGVGLMHQYGRDAVFGTKPAVNYGGGIKFLNVLGPLGVRIDARGYSATGGLNMFELTGGVLIHFGR